MSEPQETLVRVRDVMVTDLHVIDGLATVAAMRSR